MVGLRLGFGRAGVKVSFSVANATFTWTWPRPPCRGYLARQPCETTCTAAVIINNNLFYF